MGEFFSYNYTGKPFKLMGTAQIGALIIILALNLFLLRYRHKDEAARRKVRITIAILIYVNEASWHFWNIYHGVWTIQEDLPFHTCGLLIWLSGFMLIGKNYRVYEFAYFQGITGGLLAMLTPDLGIYGFPHYRFFQIYIAHGLLVTSAIYMTTVEGFRPTWNSIKRVFIFLNLFALAILGLNRLIGSNYLYISQKPPVPIMDILPGWPFYFFFMEAFFLFAYLLLYLPFIIQDRRAYQRENQPYHEPQ